MAAPTQGFVDVFTVQTGYTVARVKTANVGDLGTTVRRRIKVNPFQAGLTSEGLAVPPLQIGLQLPR